MNLNKLNDENKNQINDFIKEQFNYYNGRINKINYSAGLNIIWDSSDTRLGYTSIPCIVTINPATIYSICDNEHEFYCEIIDTVIHELYHVDQNVDYNIDTENYMNDTEDAVINMTSTYCMINRINILNRTGYDMTIPINEDSFPRSELLYHRTDPYTHIYHCLAYMISRDGIIHEYIRNHINLARVRDGVYLIISINGYTVELISDSEPLPMWNINILFCKTAQHVRSSHKSVGFVFHSNDSYGDDSIISLKLEIKTK